MERLERVALRLDARSDAFVSHRENGVALAEAGADFQRTPSVFPATATATSQVALWQGQPLRAALRGGTEGPSCDSNLHREAFLDDGGALHGVTWVPAGGAPRRCAFQGVPRELRYDNPESVVLERQGALIRFHPQTLELSGHYHFAPKPVAVGRGNEKGGVERRIRVKGARPVWCEARARLAAGAMPT